MWCSFLGKNGSDNSAIINNEWPVKRSKKKAINREMKSYGKEIDSGKFEEVIPTGFTVFP